MDQTLISESDQLSLSVTEIKSMSLAAIRSNKVIYMKLRSINIQNYDFSRVYALSSPNDKWRHIGDLQRIRYYHTAW